MVLYLRHLIGGESYVLELGVNNIDWCNIIFL